MLEGDAEVVIRASLSKEVDHPKYGHVIQDILAQNFWVCNFAHVKHLGNSIAHFLARHSKSGSKLQVWINSIPDDIAPLVMKDLM